MGLPTPRNLRAVFVCLLAILANSACTPVAPYAGADPTPQAGYQFVIAAETHGSDLSDGLFGRRAVAGNELGPRTRWMKVIARYQEQRRDTCADACPQAAWQKLVAELRTLPLAQRIERVNAVFNAVPYVPATVNWHDVAYWETPFEFLARGGQCQDYAIAKYLALLESGVPEKDLRFVVVRDVTEALDHAITVVDVAGEAVALDNQVKQVVPARSLEYRYAPYYALNDLGWSRYIAADQPAFAWQPPQRATVFKVAHY